MLQVDERETHLHATFYVESVGLPADNVVSQRKIATFYFGSKQFNPHLRAISDAIVKFAKSSTEKLFSMARWFSHISYWQLTSGLFPFGSVRKIEEMNIWKGYNLVLLFEVHSFCPILDTPSEELNLKCNDD